MEARLSRRAILIAEREIIMNWACCRIRIRESRGN